MTMANKYCIGTPNHEMVFNYTVLRSVNENCILLQRTPTTTIFMLYAFIVPVLAAFGLCANFINALVFMRPKMKPSAFTYLAALSWLDCLSCILIMFTAMARSFFYSSPIWISYDYRWQTPLCGISTGAANLILACVSFDRLVYLTRYATLNAAAKAPKFCRRKVARCMVVIVLLISVVVNMPYFFVFVVNADGSCQMTNFYYSEFYKIHNWFTFILLAVLPAIFLLVGNLAIIIVFRRWTRQSKLCQRSNGDGCRNSQVTQKRHQHQMKLTITIVIVITLYMIGELPAHMTSRKSALNLLFGGDMNRVNLSTMETVEVICITLNALQLSMNIVVYAVINPSFMPEFFLCLRGASDVCFYFCGCEAIAKCWLRCCCNRRNETSDCGTTNTNEAYPAVQRVQCEQPTPIDDDNEHCWSTDSEYEQQLEMNSKCNKSIAIFTTRASASAYENPDCCLESNARNKNCSKGDDDKDDDNGFDSCPIEEDYVVVLS